MKKLRYILIFALAIVIGILIARASIIEADAEIEQIDSFIEKNSVEYGEWERSE